MSRYKIDVEVRFQAPDLTPGEIEIELESMGISFEDLKQVTEDDFTCEIVDSNTFSELKKAMEEGPFENVTVMDVFPA